MKTTAFYFYLLLALLAGCHVKAQTETAPSRALYGGFGHLNFSAEQLNLGGLNASLSSGSYGSIQPYTSSFGGGGSFAIHNFLIGGGGAWLMHSNAQSPENDLNLKGGYGYFSFGYIVHSGKRSILYPAIGLGGGGYDITISRKNTKEDFSQQLNSPQGMIALEAGGWLGTAQISYQYFFSKNATEGFFIGVKAGYRYSPYNWHTTMNNTDISNAPKINMNGFYVTLILGGGSLLPY